MCCKRLISPYKFPNTLVQLTNKIGASIRIREIKLLVLCWLHSSPIGETVNVPSTRRKIKTHGSQCKMSSSKKFTCKGTLRQVFIRIYVMEIANFLHSVMLVFSTQLCDLYPPRCPSPLLSSSTLPLPPFPV
jgi:hypothetical protein